jgi:hypothetical protein
MGVWIKCPDKARPIPLNYGNYRCVRCPIARRGLAVCVVGSPYSIELNDVRYSQSLCELSGIDNTVTVVDLMSRLKHAEDGYAYWYKKFGLFPMN